MRYLTIAELLVLHRRIVAETGGSAEVRDLGALHGVAAQPRARFEGRDLYPSLVSKATALGFAVALNHPFVDGNKRVGHAAMETFLLLNGADLVASVDEAEVAMLALAAGELSREQLLDWIRSHVHRAPHHGS